ncbi:MAG: VOC family protein [Chloroflexi bacterium]|nr:VOC family protein [Chloroflexota bacterium]
MIDHLVYAVPDLEAGISELQARLGVRASPGGSHTGRGTWNALLDLGEGRYLEIIAPDPGQPAPAAPRSFGLDGLVAPRFVTWAAKAPNIEVVVTNARAAGFDPGTVREMSRMTPGGQRLEWRLTLRDEPAGDGLVPFLIDWGTTPHPSANCAPGCRLLRLEAEHPDPEAVLKMLAALGEQLEVREGPSPALIATIQSPRGEVTLR